MVIYDNEFETKKNKIWTKDKIILNHNIDMAKALQYTVLEKVMQYYLGKHNE